MLLRIWLGLFCAVVVFSLLPGRTLPAMPVSDSVAHGAAYLALAALPLARAARPWAAAAGALLLAPLGLLLEVAQMAIPGRGFEWRPDADLRIPL